MQWWRPCSKAELDAIYGFPPARRGAGGGSRHRGGRGVSGRVRRDRSQRWSSPEGQPHPALLDIEVRSAIGYAIDTGRVIEDLWFGHAEPLETMSPRPTGSGSLTSPRISASTTTRIGPTRYSTTPDMSTPMVTGSGRCPTGQPDLVPSRGEHRWRPRRLDQRPVPGWMADIGIDVTSSPTTRTPSSR